MMYPENPHQQLSGNELDTYWMQQALLLAAQAADKQEVPVAAIITDASGKIISAAFNSPIALSDPTAHAEILAIRAAAKSLANYRLNDTTLYVTLEPCSMCYGAIVHSRIARVVYGASDPKTGVLGGKINISTSDVFNHSPTIHGGVCSKECSSMLVDFFKSRR